MTPRIERSAEKKLVGKRLSMSLAANKTGQLWSSFMPRRKEVAHAVGTALYSLQVYDPAYFEPFSPHKEFIKWACIEVGSFENIPEGMEPFILPAGLYAVFLHKSSNTDTSTFQYIFTTWLPQSEYVLDNRPHFEILGEKYKNNDPNSEEEIWIPIKPENKRMDQMRLNQ